MRETRCQEHILLPRTKVSISYSLKTELDYIKFVVMIEFRFLKRLSAGKNPHRATTKYHPNIIASANTNVQQIQACQNNSALTSEISSKTRILHRFHLSLASNRYLQTQRQATQLTILIGFRCLQRADRTH